MLDEPASLKVTSKPEIQAAKTPQSPSDSEKSSPNATPGSDSAFRLSLEERKTEWIQVASICWSLVSVGWVDGSTGPLLPTYQRVYGVSYTVVSLLFILSCVGSISGAGVLVLFANRLKFGKLIVLGAAVQLVGFAILAPAPPFPAMVFAFFINGFGQALQDSQANSFVACLREKSSLKMGLIHTFYGLGALVAPLVATQFAPTKHWSFHYLCSMALAFSNVVLLSIIFKFRHEAELIAQYNYESAGEKTPIPANDQAVEEKRQQKVWQNRNVHLLSFFCLLYVGVEVTSGGWIVTYIERERGGGTSSGYISTGFFGGLTVGRMVLLWVNSKVGEYRVIFIYTAIALGLEITIWLVHSLVENAVAVSLIGMVLGPMYPIMMSQAGRILPREILSGSAGWITGIGAAGSALFPFMAGALASRFGIIAMQPLYVISPIDYLAVHRPAWLARLIILLCVMATLWFLVPSHQRVTRMLHN